MTMAGTGKAGTGHVPRRPRTTGLYDVAKNNKDVQASHRVACALIGMTGQPGSTAGA